MTPHSPDAVKNALRILAYVQDDMARKLPTHAYARLPHESQEFEDELMITAAVKAVDSELQHLNALFPETLRPVPGQLRAGPGRGAGPPTGLR